MSMAIHEPPIMCDPVAAKAYVRAGGVWKQKCVMELCPTEIQGGEQGMIAHLEVVHKIKPKPVAKKTSAKR